MTQPPYRIRFIRKRLEYEAVYTLVFEPVTPVPYAAGQYAFVTVGTDQSRHTRELSFACAPNLDELRFCVKATGSQFKQRLLGLVPGEIALINQVAGRMVAPVGPGPMVLVAQGIAAAPVLALLEAGGLGPTTVVHVARTQYVYGDRLRELAQTYLQPGRTELPARLRMLRREQPAASFYVAGAPVFVANVAAQLHGLGLTYDDLRTTMFDTYTDATIS